MRVNIIDVEADLRSGLFVWSLMANGGIWFGLSDPRSQPQATSTMMTERFYRVCVCMCV